MALDNEEGDWNYYYVNRFVNRDMLMCYIGGGVGHCWRIEEPAAKLNESNETPTDTPDGGEVEDEPEEGDDPEPTDNPEIEGKHGLDAIDELENGEELEELEEEDVFESDHNEGEENDVDEEWDNLFGF
ncbi:hypothetical protein FRC08_007994 [Ceratobasidium sp. 394]|nr:hypothetical protein FRC08_007994 [Ceratobasidium sp. 394]KAG9076438.1 hypothetical protein FS749_011796 [Ceratobasidium sp. UAMH 11750]